MKLFASDFDGTFYFNGKKEELFLKNISTVKKFQENHTFAFVTGREVNSLIHHIHQYDFKPDYIACNNGGIIYDKNMNVLYSNPLNVDFEKLMKLIEKENVQLISMCSKSRGFFRHFIYNEENEKSVYNFYQQMNVTPVSTLEELDKTGIYMASLYCNNDEHAKKVAKIICESDLGCSAFANRMYIDIVSKGVSKRNAVEMIAKHANIQEIYTIGDSFNDMNMIEYYHGFAVEDANEEVKLIAKQVVSSVSDAIMLLNQHE